MYDAIILSYAGIKSLNIDYAISQVFSVEEIIPSAGQGIIALQSRKNDNEIAETLENYLFKNVFKINITIYHLKEFLVKYISIRIP